jgi:hypothetical protein
MIDMELAEQEHNWRESLAESLRTDSDYYRDEDEENEEEIINRAIARRS